MKNNKFLEIGLKQQWYLELLSTMNKPPAHVRTIGDDFNFYGMRLFKNILTSKVIKVRCSMRGDEFCMKMIDRYKAISMTIENYSIDKQLSVSTVYKKKAIKI